MQVSRPVLINTLKKVVAFIPKVKSSTSTGVVSVDPLENEIKISLSYPEASITTKIGALSDPEESSIKIHGHKFLSIVGLSDKEIVFTSDGSSAEIRSGTSLWKEPMPAAYTYTGSQPESPVCTVDSYALLTAFNAVKYAVDYDSVRPALFMVDVIDGRVRACNGFQYHEVDLKIPSLSFSISGGMVDSFCAVLRYFDGNIDFYDGSDSYFFNSSNTSISVRKLAASFPDLDRLLVRPLKSESPALLQVDKNALINAVKRVKIAIDDSYPYVEVHINKSEVLVRGTQKSGAEAVTSVPADWASKPRIATFNAKYLLQTLGSLSAQNLELRFGADTKSSKSPMVMEGSGTWTMLNQSNLTKRA